MRLYNALESRVREEHCELGKEAALTHRRVLRRSRRRLRPDHHQGRPLLIPSILLFLRGLIPPLQVLHLIENPVAEARRKIADAKLVRLFSSSPR